MTDLAHQEPTNAHEHARAYGALGLRTLPIRVGGKAPPMKSWQHAATNDPAKIDAWYKGLYRDCGVGIALGDQPNGWHLFALDLDNHGDGTTTGEDELVDLEQTHGALPDTWRAITGSGGVHLIFRTPEGVTVRNQQATGNRVAPNIDVRGQGGQIVAAPTIHPETLNAYAWEHDYEPWSLQPAVAPDWLLDMVREPDPTPEPPKPVVNLPRDDTLFEQHRADWNWHVELVALGWQQDQRDPERWTRPGKDPRQGHSAILHGDEGPFVVFTTEIPHEWRHAGKQTTDGSGWSFGPFGFYAATRHAGNRSAAAQALSDRYGIEPASLDDLIAETVGEEPTPVILDELDKHLRSMVMPWDTFFSIDHNAASWLWEPIIAETRGTAIFAPGGVGKSLIMLRLSIDIAKSGRRVLYLDYEMTSDDLADRLDDMGYDGPHPDLDTLFYAQLPDLSAFDTKAGAQEVVRMAELFDAELVVIDTFARAIEGDENEADTYRRFYNLTGQELKRREIGYARLDHAGKDVSKGQRGSSAKNDDVDVVWLLKRTEDGYQLIAKKKRMGWVPEIVNLTRGDDPFTLEVKGGPSYPKGTAEVSKLLDELGVDEDATLATAQRALKDAGHGKRRQDVSAALKYRRDRSPTYHFVDDLVAVDKSGNRGGNRPNEKGPEPPPEPPNDESVSPQVNDHGNRCGNRPEPSSPVYREPGSPLKGEPVPTPPDDDPPTTLEELGL